MLTLITQSNLTLSWFEPLNCRRTFAFYDSSPARVVEHLGSKLRGLGQHLCMRRSMPIKANQSLHTLVHTKKIPLIYIDFFINFFIIIHRSAVRIREAPPIKIGTYWRHRLQFVPVTSLTPWVQTDWAQAPGDNCPYRSNPDRSP